MKNELVIKKSSEFDTIIHHGLQRKNSYFILCYSKSTQKESRFGITLSKKFGNAVKRNRYKRIIREIVRNNIMLFNKEYDYIIIIRKKCDDSNYKIMKENLINLIK